MKIEKTAGNVQIVAYTEGHPVSVSVTYKQWNGDADTFRMNPEHLHDLRYCIDRVLARLQEMDRG